jgi:uncharacterized protein YcbX
MSEVVVSGLSLTPVKGMRLVGVERVFLGLDGVRGNRRFFWIDERDRMLNGKQVGELQAVVASYADDTRRLSMTFPDGHEVSAVVRPGASVVTRFFSRPREAVLVNGPWAEAVSAYVGRPLRLVEAGPEGAVDRGVGGGASLISRASLSRLGAVAGADGALDARRFRMLIEVDGVAAHEEDAWVGRRVSVGQAVVAVAGHVGRCLVTSRDPDTGAVDLPTLELLGSYRSGLPCTEPLPFGVYGRVVAEGSVAVGDHVVVRG